MNTQQHSAPSIRTGYQALIANAPDRDVPAIFRDVVFDALDAMSAERPPNGLGRGVCDRSTIRVDDARKLFERFPHDLRVRDVLVVLDALECVSCGHCGSPTWCGRRLDAPLPCGHSVGPTDSTDTNREAATE